jgi:hypothetical protein
MFAPLNHDESATRLVVDDGGGRDARPWVVLEALDRDEAVAGGRRVFAA